MEAIVLAGGLGTRIAAKLSGVPKPMAPIAGRPFLEILLNQLHRAGCTRVILSVGHLHSVIENHFGDRFGDEGSGMRVDYVIESAPLGTGGAIRAALREATERSALVLNGDTFLDADYAAMMRFHQTEGAGLTIAITHCADITRYGGVLVSERRIAGFQEKGRTGAGWINAGAYAIDKALRWPAHLKEKFSFETEFLAREIARLAPAAYQVKGFFLDIGVPEDLDRAQTELAPFMP
ncbi:MAG TPA: nucleotidyltransferase family protein [Terracidiphilus sp.]|jgi:D-glycero-alpha-D-manno-heptose 1-phosphate guanylyltransferase